MIQLSTKIKGLAYALLVLLILSGNNAPDGLQIVSLKCEYQENPLAIETSRPRLSWQLKAKENGQKQTAYQIIVASSESSLTEEKADFWNSGKVNTDQSVFVEYNGKPLLSQQQYWWKVKVWDQAGKATAYSKPASWEMAILNPETAFKGDWLRHPDQTDTLLSAKPAPFFRKEFTLEKEVKEARAYIAGMGYFVFSLNGKKIGDHVLDPVATRYDKRVKYVSFDISEALQKGDNAAGIFLGTGWYNHFAEAAWGFSKAPWRAYPTFKLMIDITYTDGTSTQLMSDRSWKASYGPIRFDGLRNGEVYDARLEMEGWNKPGFKDKDWEEVVTVKGPEGKLSAQKLPPIKEMAEIKPKSVREIKPGVYVFDLGQNIAGYSRISIQGTAGDSIKLKHGERLYEDGSVEQEEILRFLRSGEAQTDTYILKGAGKETWNPSFVYHGFQYIEVTGLKEAPPEDFLSGIVIHTSFDKKGSFACSNALYNQIQHNTLWSYIGNYHGFPTDCPQREKVGWSGDAHLITETGMLNFDAGSSYAKWMDDYKDEQQESGQLPGIIPTSGWGYSWTKWKDGKPQGKDPRGYGPAWESAYIQIPWDVYQYSGNKRILEEHYDGFVKYLEYLHHHADNLILNFGMGDHAAPREESHAPLTSTAYFYSNASIVANVAELLGKEADAEKYRQLAGDIALAFHQEFYNPASCTYADSMQTSLAAPLYFGLAPDSLEAGLTQNLLKSIEKWDGHLNTGILGTKYMLNTLVDQGQVETAYAMTNKRTFPSYGHWIDRGANTLWQKWNDGSRNHIMFGDISAWFYKSLAGINVDPASPGFKHILFKPHFPAEMDWVKATHESMYGTIESAWKKNGDQVILELEVPVNCTASLELPAGYILENTEADGNAKAGESIEPAANNMKIHIALESGRHRITCIKD